MIVDLQKGSLLKRVSAWMFDVIMLVIMTVGIAFVMSALLGYDNYQATVDQAYTNYETEYGVSFDIGDGYYELSDEERVKYDDAYKALTSDAEAMYAYNMVVNLTLVIISVSILVSHVVLEFIMPMVIGHGRTMGKRIFGLAVCRTDGVKVTGPIMFIRTILGKYTFETMVPVLIIIMIFFNMLGFEGTLVLGLILLLQLGLLIFTKTNSLIHDALAKTVVVDYASQLIFEDEDELIAYKKKLALEKANNQAYF